MSSLLVLQLDRDVAGHLAVAIRRHRGELERLGRAEPPGLAELQDLAASVAKSQRASGGVSRLDGLDDGQRDREYLTRDEAGRIAHVSLRTIDRWTRAGKLRSVRHGAIRRIARTDLDAFLRAA